jgi:hypothetical protein
MRYRIVIETQFYVEADSEREAQEKALKLVDASDVSATEIGYLYDRNEPK